MSGRPAPDRAVVEEALTRFVLGEADRGESEELVRLLVEHPELNAELASLQRVLTLLPHAVATPPPPGLKARILEAARASAAPRRGPLRALWPSLAAAAGLAAVGLFAHNASLRRELELQKEVAILLQQPNVVLSFAMSGTGANSGSFGSVVLDLDAKKGAVVLRRLPTLPPEKVYRLWALVGDQTVPCGQFNANADDAVRTVFPVPVDAYTAPVTRLLLTVEPASAPPRPVGPTVMVGSALS